MAVLPPFSAADFVPGAPIDNSYFPLIEGQVLSSMAEEIDPDTGEVEVERNDLFTTSETHTVRGVQTTVVRDTVYDGEILLEDTLDFHAQDADGNVWYLGEIVINYEYDDDGNFLGTNNDGAWSADDPGSEPGIIMRGEPAFGPATYEEFAPGVAEDESITVSLDETIDIDFGIFDNVVKTLNTSALAPDGAEFKYYARGIGVVFEQDIAADGEVTSSGEIYRQGQVGRGDPDDSDDVTPRLSQLREGKAVTDAAEVKDLDPADFAGDGSKMHVTFVGGRTETADALGAYFYHTATGEIGSARILLADLSEASDGDDVAVDVPEGMTLGLFLVASADEIGIDLEDYTSGGLQIRNMLTGAAANIADGIAPIVTDKAGNILPIQPLSALGSDDGTNYLNPAAGLHAVGLASVALRGKDATLIGFEDQLSTNPEQDGDFNDALVAVSAAPLSAATLALLAREADGVRLGTAADDRIIGTHRGDRIAGLAGDDEIVGKAGNDRLMGDAGADEIDGQRGRDTVRGGGGDDELDGGACADRLVGDRGDDVLEGAGGPDVFVFAGAGFGADTVLDFTRAEHDRVELRHLAGDFASFDSNGDGRLTGADDALTRADGALTLAFDSGDTIAFARIGALVESDFAFL